MRWTKILIIISLAGCSLGAGSTLDESNNLPDPATGGGKALTDALAQRRSVRSYRPQPLDEADISQLLWATQGVTSESGQRTAPSAGALYPLELYVVTASGHYRYKPDGHTLEVLGTTDLRSDLSQVSQGSIAAAPAVFVLTAVYARTEQKYGNRGERFVMMEAGHACQNLLLQAAGLGLGAVPIGAFSDTQVQNVLGLPSDHEPLYVIPVGWPENSIYPGTSEPTSSPVASASEPTSSPVAGVTTSVADRVFTSCWTPLFVAFVMWALSCY